MLLEGLLLALGCCPALQQVLLLPASSRCTFIAIDYSWRVQKAAWLWKQPAGDKLKAIKSQLFPDPIAAHFHGELGNRSLHPAVISCSPGFCSGFFLPRLARRGAVFTPIGDGLSLPLASHQCPKLLPLALSSPNSCCVSFLLYLPLAHVRTSLQRHQCSDLAFGEPVGTFLPLG